MKFRRRPIVRDVVDAIKTANSYVYANDQGETVQVPAADFERDYEAVSRAPRTTKPKKAGGRRRRGNGAQPGAAAE